MTKMEISDRPGPRLPGQVTVRPDALQYGKGWRCVRTVRAFPPRTDLSALLSPIASIPGVRVHLYFRRTPGPEAERLLSKAGRRTRMHVEGEATEREVRREEDYLDLRDLILRLRGSGESLFDVLILLEMEAPTQRALRLLCEQVRLELRRGGIEEDRLWLRQRDAFLSCTPTGDCLLPDRLFHTMPASSAANLYPFSFASRSDPHGLPLGDSPDGGRIAVDLTRMDSERTNSHCLILGNSGEGKSYLLRLLCLHFRLMGRRILLLDAEDEYRGLTRALGGTYVDLCDGEHRINPLQPRRSGSGKDTVGDFVAQLKDFFRIYRDMDDELLGTLEFYLRRLYRTCFLDFSDPVPQKEGKVPLPGDLLALIRATLESGETAGELLSMEASRRLYVLLAPMCEGSESGFFNGPTRLGDRERGESTVLTFGVKGLLDQNAKVRDAVLFNLLSYMQHELLVRGQTVLAIDELYLFLSRPKILEFIRNTVKRARKRDSACILASQNLEDFLQEHIREMAKPLFAIPTYQFLFYGGTVDRRLFCDMLHLSAAEYAAISGPGRGKCLFRCGGERMRLNIKAPDWAGAICGEGR
ncbi:MAG: VirB4 family type IV secretion system protein [Clostridia bacterium]|nr:VirB4 family type IV secretion system protein [Clostridia bacterium]